MSSTEFPDASVIARQTKKFLKGASAALTGRERGPDAKVRRESYDVDDRRAKPWRPIGDGTVPDALDWIDALLQTAREFDRVHKKPGERGGLGGPYVIDVLKALLGRQGLIAIDFKTGRLDPAYATLEKVTGYARGTLVRALAKLKEHGFLNWVRRSRKTDNEGEFGPQREQASNAYYFDFQNMPKAVLQRFCDLLRAARRRRAARPSSGPAGQPRPPQALDPGLAAALDALGAAVCNGKPPSTLYPSSGV